MVKKTGLCLPVILYIVWTIICVCLILAFMFKAKKTLGSNKHEHLFFVLVVIIVLLKLVFAILVCSAMDYLCCSGHSNWAWFIIASIAVITALTIYSASSLENSVENMQDGEDDDNRSSGGSDIEHLVQVDEHPSESDMHQRNIPQGGMHGGATQGGVQQGGMQQGGMRGGVPQGVMSGGMHESGMTGQPEAFNNFYK